MARRFTLQEAESLLPQVSHLVSQAVSLKGQYEEAERTIEALTQRIMFSGGLVVDREKPLEVRQQRDRAGERLKAALESIQELGCLVKDLDIGLIDFPTLFHGQEVYLCWKMGESEIRFWHGTQEGFAGRKPIDQDFLDHHEGDPAQ